MRISFRLMGFAALLTIVSYCSAYLWATLDTLLGSSPTAYLIFFATTFGMMTVMMFALSLLGVFADGRLNLE
jgi:hypothetical protein